MKKIILLAFFAMSFTTYASFPSDAWCKVSTTASENQGYCVEGTDGKGKCLRVQVEGASRCSADQPESPEML